MQMRLLLSSIALFTFSILANAQAADDHVKIGVLTDMNGPYAAITGKGSSSGWVVRPARQTIRFLAS